MLAQRFTLLVQAALATGALVMPGCYSAGGGDDDAPFDGGEGGTAFAGSGGTGRGGSAGRGGRGGSTSTGGRGGTTAGGSGGSAGTTTGGSGGSAGTTAGGSGGTTGGTGGIDTTAPTIVSAALASNGSELNLTFQNGEDLAALTGVDPNKFRLSFSYVYTEMDCVSQCVSLGSSSYPSYVPYGSCHQDCSAFGYTTYRDVGVELGGSIGQHAVSALELIDETHIDATLTSPISVLALCTAMEALGTGVQVGLYLHYTDALMTGTQTVGDTSGNLLEPVAEDWAITPGNGRTDEYLGYDTCYASCEYFGSPCTPTPCMPTISQAGAFSDDPILVDVTCP